jgi:ferredoxin
MRLCGICVSVCPIGKHVATRLKPRGNDPKGSWLH